MDEAVLHRALNAFLVLLAQFHRNIEFNLEISKACRILQFRGAHVYRG